MNDDINVSIKKHGIIISGRKSATLTGIESIDGFDDQSIVMKTVADVLSIQGSELHVDKFDASTGDMTVSGNIDAVVYYDVKKKPDKKKNAGHHSGQRGGRA